MATVHIPAPLRALTGGEKQVLAPGDTLREVLDRLDERYPGLKERLVQGDRMAPGMAVFVDGAMPAAGLRTKISPDAEIYFAPAIAGGRQRLSPSTRSRDGSQSNHSHEFLLKEYEHFADSFWKNEGTGEQRLTFFTTLVTAVATALAALGTNVNHIWDKPGFYWATVIILASMLVFGWLLMLRMVQRNKRTDEYKGAMETIRLWYKERDQRLAHYQPLDRPLSLALAPEYLHLLVQCKRLSETKSSRIWKVVPCCRWLTPWPTSQRRRWLKGHTAKWEKVDSESDYKRWRDQCKKLRCELIRGGLRLSDTFSIFPGGSGKVKNAWIIEDFGIARTHELVKHGGKLSVHLAPSGWPRGSLAEIVASINSILFTAFLLVLVGPYVERWTTKWQSPSRVSLVWCILGFVAALIFLLSLHFQWRWIQSERKPRLEYT